MIKPRILLSILALCASGEIDASSRSSVATEQKVRLKKRAVRQKERKETRELIRGDMDHAYRKKRVLDVIAQAQQEGEGLARRALIESWKGRAEERFLKEKAWGKYAHICAVPTLPAALQAFRGTHALSVDYSYTHDAKGFDENGNIVDGPVVRFGKIPTVSEVVLASKMAMTANATAGAGYEFLQDLSAQPLPFQASITTHECVVGYALGLLNNRFQWGVRIPFKTQSRTLRQIPDVTTKTQDILRDRSVNPLGGLIRNEVFRDYYGISVENMVMDVIRQKNMKYRDVLSKTSIGDVSLFANINFYPWRLERWTMGCEVLVPFEKSIDTESFYPLIPQSGGFLSVKLHNAFLAQKTALGNPYLQTSAQFFFPAVRERRVPRIVSATGVTILPDSEVFGNDLTFEPVQNINQKETPYSDFASRTAYAHLQQGFGLDVRVGSVITPFSSPLFQADIYYHLHMRASDEVRPGLSRDVWYTDALLSPVHRSQHKIGCSLMYQPTCGLSLRAGFSGVVMGREMPLEISGFIGMSGVV